MIAYLKKDDWLKPVAGKVIGAIESGRLQGAVSSSSTFHEMYYVFSEHAPLETILADFARVMTIKNLKFIDAGTKTYLSALHLAKTYGMKSIFDAIYAATALSGSVPDHALLSTDSVFDRVPGLRHVRPEELRL
ncbi:MAG: PIN domain-containing protein [Nitrososphaerota archaeon]|nr:PIN domain-containing protein [Nitrososphaerota archaeon]